MAVEKALSAKATQAPIDALPAIEAFSTR